MQVYASRNQTIAANRPQIEEKTLAITELKTQISEEITAHVCYRESLLKTPCDQM